MIFKYEFEDEYFSKGECWNCPLSYQDKYSNDRCVLCCRFDECPLEEVDE